MADEGFKPKLTAILSADVIGYSRLMRDDEEATVRELAAHRVLVTEIIQPNEQIVTQKLSTILSADVKDYSILMADDDIFTIKTLKEYLSRIYSQLYLKRSHSQPNFST